MLSSQTSLQSLRQSFALWENAQQAATWCKLLPSSQNASCVALQQAWQGVPCQLQDRLSMHCRSRLCAAFSQRLTVNTLLLEGQVLLICLDVGGGGQGSTGLHGARWARSGQLSAQRPAGRARWASRRCGRRDVTCPSGCRHRSVQLSTVSS